MQVYLYLYFTMLQQQYFLSICILQNVIGYCNANKLTVKRILLMVVHIKLTGEMLP